MIELELEQDSKEWHEFRRMHIGSSDAPIIMGVSIWSNPLNLWEQKLSIVPQKESNFAMQRGKYLEPIALSEFENEMGVLMCPKVLKSSSIDYIAASLDGISLCKKIAVEIKCPGKKDHEVALSGKIPEKYIPQLQHQLYVSELDKMYYFSYTPTSSKTIEIYRDDKYIEILLEKERIFWKSIQDFDVSLINT